MKHRENYKKVISQMRDILKSVKYSNLRYCEIYENAIYLNESQIRALQVIARQKYLEDPFEFENFCENVKIYSGRFKSKSTHIMQFDIDGRFKDSFDDGFYTSADDLSMILLRKKIDIPEYLLK